MKYDGTIWIDTKIDESGMKDGFNRMRDGANDVATSFRNAGKVIENSFSGINFNKTIENLKAQIKGLEAEFDAVSREFEDALKFDDDKSAERLGSKRTQIYDRIARAREKLAVEVAAAAQKEAAAEEKASQRVIAAERKEAAAKKNALSEQFDGIGRSADMFGTRLRGIVASAFVFNIISEGLRGVTSYFGSALMANNQFANAVNRLRGSLMVAFQPIYESVLPALITLINWLNVAVQAVARFFSALAGKSYSQMQSNASSLNSSMGNLGNSSNKTGDSVEDMGDAIEDAGEKAKKAEKYLAGFDEINRMLSKDTEDLSNNLDNTNIANPNLGDFQAPIFDSFELPKEWTNAIDKLAMRFKDIFFEWDNLTPEIIAEKLLTALTAVAGGLIGFALNGPGGALIGMVVGAGLGVVLSSLIFNGDGKLSADEFIHALVIALGIIGGGLIGFSLGKGPGAAIGIAIGAALSIGLTQGFFKNDGQLTYEELEKSLLSVILTLGGALIGFSIGPGGALIGMTVGAALSFILTKADITQQEGTITGEQLLHELVDILILLCGGAIGFFIGGQFGPAGAAIGAVVGLALSFALSHISFEPIQKEFENLKKKVSQWSKETTQTTEGEFISPVKAAINNLVSHIKNRGLETKDSIESNMELAATSSDNVFFQRMTKWSNLLAENMKRSNKSAGEMIADMWKNVATQIELGFIVPTKKKIADASTYITDKFKEAQEKVQERWRSMANWFQVTVTEPISKFFQTLCDGIVERFRTVTDSVNDVIDNLIDNFNSLIESLANGINNMMARFREARNMASSGSSRYSEDEAGITISQISYPTAQVPMLARGAVIPPNHKFLAVLGDQTHGTNVEAPLTTIQEAVAVVMEDMIQSNIAGHEATVSVLQQILEAVLGIELDGETLSNAVGNYNKKMAMVRGG